MQRLDNINELLTSVNTQLQTLEGRVVDISPSCVSMTIDELNTTFNKHRQLYEMIYSCVTLMEKYHRIAYKNMEALYKQHNTLVPTTVAPSIEHDNSENNHMFNMGTSDTPLRAVEPTVTSDVKPKSKSRAKPKEPVEEVEKDDVVDDVVEKPKSRSKSKVTKVAEVKDDTVDVVDVVDVVDAANTTDVIEKPKSRSKSKVVKVDDDVDVVEKPKSRSKPKTDEEPSEKDEAVDVVEKPKTRSKPKAKAVDVKDDVDVVDVVEKPKSRSKPKVTKMDEVKDDTMDDVDVVEKPKSRSKSKVTKVVKDD